MFVQWRDAGGWLVDEITTDGGDDFCLNAPIRTSLQVGAKATEQQVNNRWLFGRCGLELTDGATSLTEQVNCQPGWNPYENSRVNQLHTYHLELITLQRRYCLAKGLSS